MIQRKLHILCSVLILLWGSALLHASSDKTTTVRKENPPLPPEEIIRKFADKEEEFRKAREGYIYRQTVRIEVLTLDGGRTGEEYFMISDILFDDKGRRVEKVVKSPPSTLRSIILMPEDLADIQNIYPFVLNSSHIGKYNVTYLGKEKVDELDTYVFDVSPKTIEKEDRYFEGKIWVDDHDLQIVKTYGKTVYQVTRKNKDARFPRFETYRENIDGKYWFPTYTKADDVLQFPTGNVRVREIVKYENYKKFEAEVKITVGNEVSPDDKKSSNPPKQ